MPHPILAKIAEDTLTAITTPPDSSLSSWANDSPPPESAEATPLATQLVLLKSSTIEGVQHCIPLAHDHKIGVLNFASATRPGGGFLSGARAQEESIARSSNLYSSLMTPQGQRFYALHKSESEKKNKYYTHAMIYTRGGAALPERRRGREGGGDEKRKTGGGIKTYFKPVATASSSSSSPPQAAPPKDVEKAIEDVMRERMGRILYLFENEGTQILVLGSFGTGVFRNKVPMVARLWVELLVAPNARFKHSFRHVVFAIIDEKTCAVFREVFTELGVDFVESGA
ncbi:DUF2263 domain-containing protein [Mycena sanguinolenta]|uniref:DUF2263 domain-containing protein n=1 Tax=Mycena sanguinolenta TaxID=230812 RepID=A0A8H6Y1M8_9AGAR|nr:DUF2263 domain-containing protein [Mycena sanguinolenta]